MRAAAFAISRVFIVNLCITECSDGIFKILSRNLILLKAFSAPASEVAGGHTLPF
jgi:hypothetical protein